MYLWALAVVGSVLVVTQSVLTAPMRQWLAFRADNKFQPATSFLCSTFGKLLSCPMCSGFWLGLAWALALNERGSGAEIGIRPVAFFCYSFGGSFLSALGVGLWLLIGELTAALSLYRFREQLPPGLHLERIRLAERLGSSATQVACPRFDCDAIKGERCQVS